MFIYCVTVRFRNGDVAHDRENKRSSYCEIDVNALHGQTLDAVVFRTFRTDVFLSRRDSRRINYAYDMTISYTTTHILFRVRGVVTVILLLLLLFIRYIFVSHVETFVFPRASRLFLKRHVNVYA